MNPSSHSRTSNLKENLNFKMQGETSVFILPHKTSFWHFYQSGTLPDKVNMEVSSNISNKMLFELLACMHWESIGSFKKESCSIRYVLRLNWNWRAPHRAIISMVLNYIWNWNFSEVAISTPKVGSVNLPA